MMEVYLIKIPQSISIVLYSYLDNTDTPQSIELLL